MHCLVFYVLIFLLFTDVFISISKRRKNTDYDKDLGGINLVLSLQKWQLCRKIIITLHVISCVNKDGWSNAKIHSEHFDGLNPYPAETKSDLSFATSVEPGPLAHLCSLTRFKFLSWFYLVIKNGRWIVPFKTFNRLRLNYVTGKTYYIWNRS